MQHRTACSTGTAAPQRALTGAESTQCRADIMAGPRRGHTRGRSAMAGSLRSRWQVVLYLQDEDEVAVLWGEALFSSNFSS